MEANLLYIVCGSSLSQQLRRWVHWADGHAVLAHGSSKAAAVNHSQREIVRSWLDNSSVRDRIRAWYEGAETRSHWQENPSISDFGLRTLKCLYFSVSRTTLTTSRTWINLNRIRQRECHLTWRRSDTSGTLPGCWDQLIPGSWSGALCLQCNDKEIGVLLRLECVQLSIFAEIEMTAAVLSKSKYVLILLCKIELSLGLITLCSKFY